MAPTSTICDVRNRKDSDSDEDELKYLNLPAKLGEYGFRDFLGERGQEYNIEF